MPNLARALRNLLWLSILGLGERYRSAEGPATRRQLEVELTACHDGDTCRGRGPHNIEMTLRLIGIDAPELDQAFAREARDELRRRVLGKKIRGEIRGADRYGRYLAALFDEQGFINEELVRKGFAFAYRFKNKGELWALDAEKSAREKGLGLWALRVRPEEPKIHRQKSRINRSSRERGLRRGP